MPKVVATPGPLRPYLFHGLDLDWQDRDHAVGDCPWCGREAKFTVTVKTGLWGCFVCGEKGNVYTFLRKLWDESDRRTGTEVDDLAQDRKLLYPETPSRWGTVLGAVRKDWLIPGYGADGKLVQLYRYGTGRDGRRVLYPTPGCDSDGRDLGHAIHAPTEWDRKAPEVWVCEGPWDAMALWEAMRVAKGSGEGLTVTANESASLLSTATVVAVPGCGSIGDPLRRWLPLFAGRRVVLCFDSDHPREHGGKSVAPAGWSAARRAAEIMSSGEHPPAEVQVLQWGQDGYDPNRKSGWDVRDHLDQANDAAGRVRLLAGLRNMVVPIPDDWVSGRSASSRRKGSVEVETLPCTSWDALVNSARKALRWIEGLDRALSVMMASAISTERTGDQLWVKVVGPPSCGKSVLCEALSTSRKYVYPKDTMTGLLSGYQVDKEGGENMSLVTRLNGKTLVIKDGDTLLQMPNLPQILSQLRAAYDRAIRSQYGNRMSADHEGLNITVILCGTESLRRLDSSELGERMLDCVIAETVEADLEDEIALRKVYQAERELEFHANGSIETREAPEMVEFKRMAGGYLEHLRENVEVELSRVVMDDPTRYLLVTLGTFVAYMRSRPSKAQEESAQRELSYRLVSQLTRLGKCLAVVLGRDEVDAEVMRRVRRVVLDTARGRTMTLAKHLARVGRSEGATVQQLLIWTGETEDAERKLLRHMRRIGVVEVFESESSSGLRQGKRWRLTERMSRIWKGVVDGQ